MIKRGKNIVTTESTECDSCIEKMSGLGYLCNRTSFLLRLSHPNHPDHFIVEDTQTHWNIIPSITGTGDQRYDFDRVIKVPK